MTNYALWDYEITTNDDNTLKLVYTIETEESDEYGENYYYTTDEATFNTLPEIYEFLRNVIRG